MVFDHGDHESVVRIERGGEVWALQRSSISGSQKPGIAGMAVKSDAVGMFPMINNLCGLTLRSWYRCVRTLRCIVGGLPAVIPSVL